MSTTIDSLNFDFTASNVDIDGKVDVIVETLGKLSDSLSKLSPTRINKISESMTSLANGLHSIASVNHGAISNVAESISKFSDTGNLAKTTEMLNGVSRSMERVGDAKPLTKLADNAGKLSGVIKRIDEAANAAMQKHADYGKDWNFDGTIESANNLIETIQRMRSNLINAFNTEIRSNGVFDSGRIEAYGKQMAEFGNMLSHLRSKIVELGKDTNSSASGAMAESVARISESANAASESIDKVTDSFKKYLAESIANNKSSDDGWISPDSIEARIDAFIKMRTQMAAISQELSNMQSMGDAFDPARVDELTKRYWELKNNVEKISLNPDVKNELDAFVRKTVEAAKETGKLRNVEMLNLNWDKVSSASDKTKELSKAAEEAALNFKAIAKFELPQLSIGTRFTNEAKELIANIQKAEEQVAKLKNKLEKTKAAKGFDSTAIKGIRFDYERQASAYNKLTDQFRELQAQGKLFENIRDTLEGLDFEPASLKNGEKYTESYKKLVSQIENARKSLERLGDTQDRMVHFGEDYGKGWQKNQYSIERARQKLSEYIGQAHSMESAGGAIESAGTTNKAASAVAFSASKIKDVFNKILSSIKKTAVAFVDLGAKGVKAFSKITVTAIGGVIKGFARIGSAAKSLTAKFIELSGVTKMFGDPTIFAKFSKALRKVATLAVFMFLRSSIRNIFDMMRQGLDNIVQVSEKANAALSSFATNVTYIKNSFAAMVTPILYVVYPALERLTNMLAFAANQIAAFFAAFTGQKTFTQAIRVQEDYAASLSGTAKEAGKLHKQLAGFDDLNNLTTSQNNDNALPSVQDMFREIEVPDNIKKFADKIKGILKTDDWSEIGDMIADKLNSAMSKIPWDNIEKNAQRIAKGIGTLINGFVEKFDWALLGKTIAKGLNTAIHFANTLLETIDFHRIGEKFGVAFKSFVDEFDFDGLGRLMANKMNVIIDTVHGFLTEMEDAWYRVGGRVGEAVDSFFRNIHLQEALEIISLGLNGIADFVNGFVDRWVEDSRGWGEKIGSAIDNMFNKIRWSDIGKAVDNGLKLIVTFFEGFLDSIKETWGNAGKGISDMIKKAFNPETFERAGKVVSGFVNGVITFFKKLFESRSMWERVGESLGKFVNSILTGIDFAGAVQVIVNFVNGFFNALAKFNDSIEWKKVSNNIAKGINAMIHGVDSAKAGKVFGEFVLNILGAIHDVVKQVDWKGLGRAVGEFLANIPWGQIIGEVFAIIWEVASGLIRGLFDTGSGKIALAVVAGIAGINILGGLLSWLDPTKLGLLMFAQQFSGVGASISGAMGTALSSVGSTITSAFASTGVIGIAIALAGVSLIANWGNVVRRFEEAGGGIKGFFHGVLEAWQSPLKLITKLLDTVFGTNLSAIVNKVGDFKHKLLSHVLNIKDTVSKTWEAISSVTKKVWTAISTSLSDTWNTIKSKAETAFGRIGDAIASAWDRIKGATERAWDGIKNLLIRTWESISDAARRVFDGIKAIAESAFNGVKSIAQGIFDTLTGAAQSAFSKAQELVSNIGNAISNGVGSVRDAIGSVVRTIGDGLQSGVRTALENGREIAFKIGDGIRDAGRWAKEKAGEVISSIIGTISDGIRTAYENGREIAFKIGDGIRDAAGWAKEKAGELLNGISNAAKSVVSKASEIGSNVASGLASGVQKAASTVTNAAKTVATKITGATRFFLKVKSPSRVFFEIGENVVAGLNNGIEAMASTSRGVVESWVDKFTSVDASVNFKANMDGLSDLKPNYGAELDLQRALSMQSNVSIDGSEIKNLVHAIELMTMQDQAAMRTQTEYLQQIANKSFTIGQRDVFQAVQNEAVSYELRTGQPAFGY